jgi:hypothetical protein
VDNDDHDPVCSNPGHRPSEGRAPAREQIPDRRRRPGSRTIRSTSAAGCAVTTTPAPFTPTWKDVTGFLDRHLKAR